MSDSRLNVRVRMVKAEERPSTRAYWAEIGACLLRAKPSDWTLDMLADRLKRDPRQVRRWCAGEEQTQVAAVFAVPELQQPFVIELAKLAACEVTTVVTVRSVA